MLNIYNIYKYIHLEQIGTLIYSFQACCCNLKYCWYFAPI